MIGWLRGVLRDKHPPALLLEVGGVGYEIDAPMTTFYQLPQTGAETTLFTHLLVREDAHQLFGFATVAERDAFRALLRVNGVGAKVALALLSGMEVGELARCVREADAKSLARVPGIGRKTAERLIVEMRDRLPGAAGATRAPASGAPAVAARGTPASEAIEALSALGFKPAEAAQRVREVAEEGLSREELVRRALRGAGR